METRYQLMDAKHDQDSRSARVPEPMSPLITSLQEIYPGVL